MRYPPARRQAASEVLHGTCVPDPYRWLEDAESPETRRWLAAQDALWRDHAATLPARDRLRARAAELAGIGMVTAPMWRGDTSFFLRRTAGQEHAVLHLAAADGHEQVLVDPMRLDPSGLTTLDAWQPDLEGRRLAYQVSRHGTERSELYVLDIKSGYVVEGPIDRCRYSPLAWLPGGEAFFYVRAAGESLLPQRVYLHWVGAPAAADVEIFGSGRDETTTYGLGISRDGRWLVVSASPGVAPRNDLWLADLSVFPAGEPDLRVVQEGVHARSAFTVGGDGRMYVVTDREAPRIRLCTGDPERPAVWTDLVPEDPEAVLTDFAVLDGPELGRSVLLVAWMRHSVSEISVHDLATGERLGDVPLPGAGAAGPLSTRLDGAHEAWFTYSDTVTPGTVWRYDHRTGETTPWARPPGSVTVPDVERDQIVCSSADGAPVRVTVLGRAREGDRPRPTILYGYGGFGLPVTPTFAADSLAWVEAGGVLAIAHVRGGGEDGANSHRAGMGERKQRVFDDFIAAAEQLVSTGWTTREQLGIWGESNGGLLVGAALTQRPDLFAAAVCSAPLLDMVRYEGSGLGAAWKAEYGSVADPEQFRRLLGYSPYHSVREQVDYPATLFTVFGGDSRVDPFHARKMCAALQWATRGSGPILLRHEGETGHSARPAGRSIELAADMLAFLAAHTGLSLPAR
ncbi:prolyl oligopeptidase family serine peptidase [Actinomadura scrupuli]|uniref:prolyl oligopeptidase family serine peptidase n=1 Tax=Actinomadura scrupuli TaxID=559629 RepID=UPI003D96740C